MVFLALEHQLNLENLETFHVVEKTHRKYLWYYSWKTHLFYLN